MPRIKLNDIEMYYEVHGKGPPLILVSGFTANHLSWHPCLPLLKKKYQVILFDHRGSGKTDVPDTPYSVEQFAEDTLHLLNFLKIEKGDFVCQSMGSAIGQILAHKAKERIRKMVLAAPFSERRQTTAVAFEKIGNLYREGLPYPKMMELFLPFLFSDFFLKNNTKVQEFMSKVEKDPYPISPKGYFYQLEALNIFNSKSFLPSISIPISVIGYELDICTFLDEARFVASQVPKSKFLVMEKVGHSGNIEDLKQFWEIALAEIS